MFKRSSGILMHISSLPGEYGIGDFGKKAYGGPCPPSGTHRYFFTIYALDVEKLENVNKNNFLKKIEEHTIEKTTLIGLYQRKSSF